MKRISLIIILILAIFQMVVIMAAIDIGNPAIYGDTAIYSNTTFVDNYNPADGTGVITSVEIYTYNAMTNVEVATFYVVSGNNLSTRDTESIGNLAQGYNQVNVNLNVIIGDFIGIYSPLGNMRANSGAEKVWRNIGTDSIPCTDTTFELVDGYKLRLYGTGATEEAPPSGGNAIMMGINF